MFSADMANEEWELEISPSSRYYTEDEPAFAAQARNADDERFRGATIYTGTLCEEALLNPKKVESDCPDLAHYGQGDDVWEGRTHDH
jgi:hypothetical protein